MKQNETHVFWADEHQLLSHQDFLHASSKYHILAAWHTRIPWNEKKKHSPDLSSQVLQVKRMNVSISAAYVASVLDPKKLRYRVLLKGGTETFLVSLFEGENVCLEGLHEEQHGVS